MEDGTLMFVTLLPLLTHLHYMDDGLTVDWEFTHA
jgi:hypothetical protein